MSEHDSSGELKPLLVWIPDSLHKQFKQVAARRGRTLKSVIISAVLNFIDEVDNDKAENKTSVKG